MTKKAENKRTEIIKVLKDSQQTFEWNFREYQAVSESDYKAVAIKIEKLFKAQQIALIKIRKLPKQIYRRDGKWGDVYSAYCEAARIADKATEEVVEE